MKKIHKKKVKKNRKLIPIRKRPELKIENNKIQIISKKQKRFMPKKRNLLNSILYKLLPYTKKNYIRFMNQKERVKTNRNRNNFNRNRNRNRNNFNTNRNRNRNVNKNKYVNGNRNVNRYTNVNRVNFNKKPNIIYSEKKNKP